jgi:outer membrane protein assembly factor BamB
VFAFDPGSGKEVWVMHHLNGCAVTPAYKDGILYAVLGDTLHAFDAHMKGGDDGIKDAPQAGDRHDIVWSCKLAAKRCSAPLTFVGDELVVNTSEGLEFYPTRVKDPSRVERIKVVKTGGGDYGGASHDGGIMVAASKAGHVAIELASGKELWKAGDGGGGTPAIDGTDVFLGDAKGTLWCVELKTGTTRWKIEGGFSDSPAAPAVCKGVVYMASNMPGTMNALDAASGKKVWSWEVPDKTDGVSSPEYGNAVYAAPVVAGGRVYFTSYSGYVYCLRTEVEAKERLAWKEKISDRVCMTVPTAFEGAVYVRGAGMTFKFAAKK